MTPEDFAALFDLWRAGDEHAAAAYFTPDGVFWEAAREPLAGRERIAAHWGRFFHGGPEWRMIVHRLFGDGERFAVDYVWEIKGGDGAWSGRPGCALVTTRDGRIAEWREYKA